MDRDDFKEISKLRINDARVLFRAKQYQGAYYMAGYSVECALKACIAKRTKRFEFPDKEFARTVWTHELETLLKSSGLKRDLDEEMLINSALKLNWTVVKDWNETKRYDWRITKTDARDFLSACTAHQAGILGWIRKRW